MAKGFISSSVPFFNNSRRNVMFQIYEDCLIDFNFLITKNVNFFVVGIDDPSSFVVDLEVSGTALASVDYSCKYIWTFSENKLRIPPRGNPGSVTEFIINYDRFRCYLRRTFRVNLLTRLYVRMEKRKCAILINWVLQCKWWIESERKLHGDVGSIFLYIQLPILRRSLFGTSFFI